MAFILFQITIFAVGIKGEIWRGKSPWTSEISPYIGKSMVENGSIMSSEGVYFLPVKGRGVRATGGWVLRRAAQTPRPAFCLLRSYRRGVCFPSVPSIDFRQFSSYLPSQHLNILLSYYITCYMSYHEKYRHLQDIENQVFQGVA